MSRGAKLLILLVSAPLLLVIWWVALITTLHLTHPCSDSVLKESAAPGGSYTAVLSEGSCGATTAVGYDVVIRSAQGEETVLIYQGQLDLSLRWISPTELLVENQTKKPRGRMKVYVMKDRHEGLSIEYEGFPDWWLSPDIARM